MKTVRPYRWGAILGCYLYRAIASAVAGLPLGYAFGRMTGGHPRGDGILWDRGGIWLLEAGRLVGPSLKAAVGQGGLIVLLAAFGWLLPLGALIRSQAPSRPSMQECLARAGERLSLLAVLLGGTMVVQALVLFGLGALGKNIREGKTPTSDVLGVVVPLGALLLWWLLGLLHDALRVVAIQRDLRWWELLNRAWELLAQRPGAMLWASAWRTGLGVAVVLGAFVLAFDATRPDGGIGLVVLLHQLAILSAVTLRASWLGWLNRGLFSSENSGASTRSRVSDEAAAGDSRATATEVGEELPA
jgi:hypothetical protein